MTTVTQKLITAEEFFQMPDPPDGSRQELVRGVIVTMPAQARPPVLMMALHIWSISHGIASLFSRGDAAGRALPMPAEELLEAAVLIYLRGLGLHAPPTESGKSK